MSDLIPVNIVIGDRTYRIKALAADEEVIRKTVKIVNDKIIEFKTQFAGKDMQDYVAMAILWYATEAASGGSSSEKKDLLEGLQKIEAQLNAVL